MCDDAESIVNEPGIDDYNESASGRPDGGAAVVGLGTAYFEGAEREP